jgi:hypothetical protein
MARPYGSERDAFKPSGPGESVRVRVHDGLRAVAHAGLGEDVVDVRLSARVDGGDLASLAIWGAAGMFVAARRLRVLDGGGRSRVIPSFR